MSDLLQSGAAWLASQMHSHAAHEITYKRGAEQLPLVATIGKTLFETTNEHGIVERIESRDFMVRAGDLILGGNVVTPLRGDHIRETAGNQTCTYEVLAPGREPAWRYSDAYRTLLRIHTKLVGTESA